MTALILGIILLSVSDRERLLAFSRASIRHGLGTRNGGGAAEIPAAGSYRDRGDSSAAAFA
jgi:hypothetical protein